MHNANFPITPHVDPPEPPADTGFKPEAEAGEVLREHETYATILADPPWRTNQQGRYGAERHYDTMTLEDIKAMGEALAPYVADNAHLYLWIPNGIVDEGLEVMEAWGFRYITSFVWIKPVMGLGQYFRTAHETVLFGVKGRLPFEFHSQPSWCFAPRQDHSHKPEEQYAIIERCSPGPYLELFARRRQPGWDAWGNEIGSDIYLPNYPVPEYSKKGRLYLPNTGENHEETR